MVESETGNWILEPGHSRPMAASIYNASGLDVPELPEIGCLSQFLLNAY